jgi:nitroreductase
VASRAPFDLDQTDGLLSTTRAVRRRLDLSRPVERDVLLDCLRLAQQAPTASNGQTWSFVVVTDAERRRALGALYRELAEAALPFGRRQIAPDDRQTARVYDSAEWLAEHLGDVPVHVIPCVRGGIDPGAAPGALAALYGSIFPAVWSFQLALRSRGLGSTLTTLHLFRADEVAALLGIPDDVVQVALLPVAYTRGTAVRPATRPPVETVVHWDGW